MQYSPIRFLDLLGWDWVTVLKVSSLLLFVTAQIIAGKFLIWTSPLRKRRAPLGASDCSHCQGVPSPLLLLLLSERITTGLTSLHSAQQLSFQGLTRHKGVDVQA